MRIFIHSYGHALNLAVGDCIEKLYSERHSWHNVRDLDARKVLTLVEIHKLIYLQNFYDSPENCKIHLNV